MVRGQQSDFQRSPVWIPPLAWQTCVRYCSMHVVVLPLDFRTRKGKNCWNLGLTGKKRVLWYQLWDPKPCWYPPRTSSAPLRQNLGLTTRRARRQIATIIQVKRCLVGCAPPYMSSKFVTNSNFGYNHTRGANKLHLKRPNTNFYKHYFVFKDAVLYNSLPEPIRTVPTERSLRSALLSISDTFD